MAAGPTRVLEMVNVAGQIFDKTTGAAITSPFSLSSFFSFSYYAQFFPVPGESLNATDPRVLYDTSTGRWYATILGYNPSTFDSGVFLAISKTSDPGASWIAYLIDIEPAGLLCDQPKLGYSTDKFVVGCSDFNSSSIFQGAVTIAASKAEGLAGTSITTFSTPPDPSEFGLVPAQNLDSLSGTTAYMAFNENPTAAGAGVIRVTGTVKNGTSTVSLSAASVPMNATTMPPAAPQKGSTNSVDSSDGRFNSAVVQRGVLYTSGGEGCVPAGDTVTRACMRFVEVSLATLSLVQGATAGVPGKYLVDPTLGLNANGDVVIDYTLSSSTDYPDLELTIQPAGDPNTYVGGGVLIPGNGPYVTTIPPGGTGVRWGDYGAAAVDPSISALVWVGGEYSNGTPTGTITTWGTEIGEVSAHFNECTISTFSPSLPSPQAPGTTITLTTSASCVSGVTPETPQYQFWIKAPGGALTMVQNYSPTNTYSWSGQVTLGTYTLEVLVRGSSQTTKPWDTYSIIQYTITATPCATPTLAANPSSSPQVAGTPVTLTAATTCGTTPQYQFWVETPDIVLHKVQDYSTTATYNWNSLNTQIGNYILFVLVKNTGSLGAYDAYTTMPYSMVLCSTPTLSTGAAISPYVSGSGAITLTATGSCFGGTQFAFFYQVAGKNTTNVWHVIGSGYAAGNTATWNADYKAGVYTLQVDLRPVGSSASFVTYAAIPFQLTGCGAPALAPSPASPQVAGTTVTWTATVGCTGTPQYQFFVHSPAGVWTLAQPWSAASTFSWISPNTAGAYAVQVWVRNAGASEDLYDDYVAAPYTLTLCSIPTLSTGAAISPYASGAGHITLTATGTCAGSTQYQFYYFDTAWHLIQAYSTATTATWNADYRAGNYVLMVEIRPVGSSAGFVTYITINPFVLSGCGLPTLAASPASPQAATTPVTWTATVSCSGTPQYQFWVQPPAGAWTIGQPWGPSSTFPWTLHTAKGTYNVQVWVRNTGAAEDLYDNYRPAPYTLS
jgi:hypothetical protein